jgi:hypothetical protein
MVGGLLEIQRVAAADELGKLTGFFYTLAYVGFLTPTVVAFTAQWVHTAWIMAGMLVLCLASMAFIGANSRKFLPQALERVDSATAPQDHGQGTR